MSLYRGVLVVLLLGLCLGCGEDTFGPADPTPDCDTWIVEGAKWTNQCESSRAELNALDWPHMTTADLDGTELWTEQIDDLTAVWKSDAPGWEDCLRLVAGDYEQGMVLRFTQP